MTRINALIGASPLALCAEHGLPLMDVTLPEGAFDTSAAVEIERCERYAISRGLAVVPLRGILTPNVAILERFLGWTTYHGLEQTMSELAANEDVQAIALVCDTPGGSTLGLEAGAAAVKAAAAAKPVHALVHPLAASAGYWIASQATDITLTPGSFVGSIGIMAQQPQPMQPGMSGDQWFIQTSSHAAAKRPDMSSEAGRALTQQRLDELEEGFLGAVSEGRGIGRDELLTRLSKTDDDAEGGDIYWGADARSRGLVDTLATEAEFFDRMSGLYAPAPARRQSRAMLARAAAAQAQSHT